MPKTSKKSLLDMKTQIQFASTTLKAIRSHLQSAFPDEGCGFFFGKDGAIRTVTDFLATENVHEGDQGRRFSIRPEDYLQAEQYALENGLDLLGIYHSHPNHPAIPSGTDLDNAVPWFSYLIVTTTADGPQDSRSWQLDETNLFQEESLTETIQVPETSGSLSSI